MISIVTNTVGIRIRDFGIGIKELTHESIKKSVIKALNLNEDEIKERSMKCAK